MGELMSLGRLDVGPGRFGPLERCAVERIKVPAEALPPRDFHAPFCVESIGRLVVGHCIKGAHGGWLVCVNPHEVRLPFARLLRGWFGARFNLGNHVIETALEEGVLLPPAAEVEDELEGATNSGDQRPDCRAAESIGYRAGTAENDEEVEQAISKLKEAPASPVIDGVAKGMHLDRRAVVHVSSYFLPPPPAPVGEGGLGPKPFTVFWELLRSIASGFGSLVRGIAGLGGEGFFSLMFVSARGSRSGMDGADPVETDRLHLLWVPGRPNATAWLWMGGAA